MAKLRIAADFLVAALFPDRQGSVRVVGATFDHSCDSIHLEVEGPAIPVGAKEVVACVTIQSRCTRFEAI